MEIKLNKENECAERAKENFRGLVLDDYTQIGFLTGFIREECPELPTKEVMKLTKQIVRELVEENSIFVVSIATELRLNLSLDEIMNEIDNVFAQTHGKPDVGDGIWFGVDY